MVRDYVWLYSDLRNLRNNILYIKYYYGIIKKFFSLKATTPVLLFHLFFSAALTTISFLSIPYIASLIIDRVTEGNWEYAIYDTSAFFIATMIYVGAHHYNYWAYYKNALSIHNNLQCQILKKVAELDEGFSENISSATIVSTSFADVNFVMRIPDYLFDFLTKIVSIFISSIILIFVNFWLGILILILALLSLYFFTFHMRQRDKADQLVYANQDNLSGLIAQVIDGHKEIHSFNMKKDLEGYLNHDLELWASAYRRRRLHTNLGEVIVPAILGFGILPVPWKFPQWQARFLKHTASAKSSRLIQTAELTCVQGFRITATTMARRLTY